MRKYLLWAATCALLSAGGAFAAVHLGVGGSSASADDPGPPVTIDVRQPPTADDPSPTDPALTEAPPSGAQSSDRTSQQLSQQATMVQSALQGSAYLSSLLSGTTYTTSDIAPWEEDTNTPTGGTYEGAVATLTLTSPLNTTTTLPVVTHPAGASGYQTGTWHVQLANVQTLDVSITRGGTVIGVIPADGTVTDAGGNPPPPPFPTTGPN